jgi:hypothetical protein
LSNEFVEIIGKHVQEQLGKEITSSKPTTAATAPAVVQSPVAPKVTSSSQVIEDDLSLLMNPSKPVEEKPVSSTKKIIKRDPNAAAVAAAEKASIVKDQTEELSKALGAPVADFGDLIGDAKRKQVIEAAEDKGEQNENDC